MDDRAAGAESIQTVGASARALRRVETVLLVAMWVGALAAWPSMPERIPIHFNLAGEADGWARHDVGGFLLWMLLPVTATGVALGMRWAGRYATRHPSAWSIPRKKEFLALSPAARAPITMVLIDFMAGAGLLTTLTLATVQLGAYLEAMGRSSAASAVLTLVFVCLGLVAVLAVWMSRTLKRAIDAASARPEGVLDGG